MTGSGSAPLVGRNAEVRSVERWLTTVAAGRAGRCLVVGEAGIGKTRLAGEARAVAGGLSFEVFAAGTDELDRSRPFGVITDALDFTPEAPVASAVPGLEFQLVDQIVERIEAIAIDRPVAVVLEDLHWADPGTLVALRSIDRRLSHLPIALMATLRPSPSSAELALLVDAWRAEDALDLTLGPLEHASVVELATALAGARPGEGLERQLSSAAGNPLFVSELVASLSDEGAIELIDGMAEVAERSLPPSLRLTILRRIGVLGDATLKLLRSASVLGSTFSPLDLATVSAQRAGAVVEQLLEARDAGVLEDAGPLLRFRHELVREALYLDLPESARRALHRDAGQALATAGAPAHQVAEQMSLGASPGDRDTIDWLWDAARESSFRAPQTAADLLERAVALAPPADPVREQLLADAAEALIWSGRPADGQSIASDLLARGIEEPTRGQARGTVVRALWLQGRWLELAERIDAWLEAPDGTLDDSVRGRLLADAAMAALFSGDAKRAEKMGTEALAIGESLGDDAVVFAALYALGPVHNFRGRKDQELAVARRALAITERTGNPDLVRFHPHYAVAMALAGQDRHDEAERMLRTGLRIREELGTLWDLPLYQAGLAELHCQQGEWNDALAEAEAGVAIAEEVGTRVRVTVCAGVAAMIHVCRDDLAAAERYLAIAEGEIERSGSQSSSYWAILAAAQLADAHGDRDLALRRLNDAWTEHEHSPGLRSYFAPALARAALLAEEDELARSVADSVEPDQGSPGIASATGFALLARGTVEHDPATLQRAVEALRAANWPHELAIACETAAVANAEQADAAGARPWFDEALEIYDRLGARRDGARARAAMRACGLRPGSRAAHRQALSGWEALTLMESDVVRLTVEGLTNRQIGERLFVSRRTVQTHLAHAFAKLDVSSRVELATVAERRASA